MYVCFGEEEVLLLGLWKFDSGGMGGWVVVDCREFFFVYFIYGMGYVNLD